MALCTPSGACQKRRCLKNWESGAASVVLLRMLCCWHSFEPETMVNPDACPSMDGMTSAGLVAISTSHRRESFLYRSSAQQDMLMMTLKSAAATSREQ